HYIIYSFRCFGLLDFSLYTGYRSDLLKGSVNDPAAFHRDCPGINGAIILLSVFCPDLQSCSLVFTGTAVVQLPDVGQMCAHELKPEQDVKTVF
ncbi:hypothetical protein, partial [Klebsiella variicola]|uniref:hypothetical protein n=1 Tax=Klebsiella variicola TaxID=244366 RepID=UPI001F2EF0A0